MKLCTVIEYDLRMCMTNDISGQKHIKGDNYLCSTGLIPYDLTHSPTYHSYVLSTTFHLLIDILNEQVLPLEPPISDLSIISLYIQLEYGLPFVVVMLKSL